MLDSHALKNWPFKEVVQTYTEADTMHYALSVGYGADPMDTRQLRFVYENGLSAVPTMAVVLSTCTWASARNCTTRGSPLELFASIRTTSL